MHRMAVSEFPCMMNNVSVFVFLFGCEILTPVWTNRHYVCCTIGKHNSGSAQSNAGHVMSKVTHLVIHRLVTRCYVTGSSIIISSEMCGDASSATGTNE